MFTVNDMVMAAYKGDQATVEKCLLQNLSIEGRAKYVSYYSIDGSAIKPPHYTHRFRKLIEFSPPKEKDCGNEILTSFTPLAAAIFGEQIALVSWLIHACGAKLDSICHSLNHISSPDSPSAPNHGLIGINMLGLSLMTNNKQLINNICKRLQDKGELISALQTTLTINGRMEIITTFDIPLKFYDINILNLLMQYLSAEQTNTDAVYSRYYQAIWQAAEDQTNDASEKLIKQLDAPRISALLIQGTPATKALNNSMLHNAVALNSTFLVNYLLDKHGDSNINIPNADQNTPLHLALLQVTFKPSIVYSLIDSGAATDMINTTGKTPLDLCNSKYLSTILLQQRAAVKNRAFNTGASEQPVPKAAASYAGCLVLPQFLMRRLVKQRPAVPSSNNDAEKSSLILT